MDPARDPTALRHILTCLAIAAACAWSTDPERAKTLAVLDLTSSGIPRADAATVSARLGRTLAATGRFRLAGRDTADGGRGPSLPTVCQDADCAVRAGRLLKVDRVVMGELAIDGPAWVVTTRMVDVATSSLLLRTSLRTENGFRDLVDRGTIVLASRYDSAESRLDAVLARHRPEEIRGIRDTAQEAVLGARRYRWRVVSGVTAVAGIGALAVGLELYAIYQFVGILDDRQPDMTAAYAWIGAGVALEAVAIVSGGAAIGLSRRLDAMKRKSLLDLTWAPVWVPSTGAVGLATRVEF